MGICTSSTYAASRLTVTVKKGLQTQKNLSGLSNKMLDLSLSQILFLQPQQVQQVDLSQRINLLQKMRPSFAVNSKEQKPEPQIFHVSRRKLIRVKVPLLDQTLENSTLMKRRKVEGITNDIRHRSDSKMSSFSDLEVNLSGLIPIPSFL